jgi:hypothetical protein
MGSALFVVLEHEIATLNTTMDGSALSKAEPRLRRHCRERGLADLMSFSSADPEDLAAQLEDETGEPVDPTSLDPEEWFPAEPGLTTVRALLDDLRRGALDLKDADLVQADLEDIERILATAADEGVRWHLAVDP